MEAEVLLKSAESGFAFPAVEIPRLGAVGRKSHGCCEKRLGTVTPFALFTPNDSHRRMAT